MISAEEWDTRWYSIYDDARADGVIEDHAREIADRETREQFGDQPNANEEQTA